jgi:N-methylhydantoinase A
MLAGEDFTGERVRALVGRLRDRAGAELGTAVAAVEVRYELRYAGQSFELAVRSDSQDPQELSELFAAEHQRRYGYRDECGAVELVNVRVSALGEAPTLHLTGGATGECERTNTRVAVDGEWLKAELWRGEPAPGTRIDGIALCALPESTLFVPPGWTGTVDRLGTIVLERA